MLLETSSTNQQEATTSEFYITGINSVVFGVCFSEGDNVNTLNTISIDTAISYGIQK